MNKPNLVLVHGWGLNKEIWFNLVEPLSDIYQLHLLSLPGYGPRQLETTPETLEALADDLLQQAPESAIWYGWSLGGMAALAAAFRQPERIQALKLVCVTPRFVNGDSWNFGTDMPTFSKFAQSMADDYKRGIQRFLLLQSGTSAESRLLAKQAAKALSKHPAPSQETLLTGLGLLERSDLRPLLGQLNTPCTLIGGRLDRIVPPQACSFLANNISGANYVELNCGHAPHLSHAEELLALLMDPSQSGCSPTHTSRTMV